jgi:hypothetical protein
VEEAVMWGRYLGQMKIKRGTQSQQQKFGNDSVATSNIKEVRMVVA